MVQLYVPRFKKRKFSTLGYSLFSPLCRVIGASFTAEYFVRPNPPFSYAQVFDPQAGWSRFSSLDLVVLSPKSLFLSVKESQMINELVTFVWVFRW